MNGLTLGLFVALLGVLMLLREGHEPTRYPTTDIPVGELLRTIPIAILGTVVLFVFICAAFLVLGS
jgi:hypothetical protein